MHSSDLEAAVMSFPAFTIIQIFVSRGIKSSSRSFRKVLSSELAGARSTGMTYAPFSYILSLFRLKPTRPKGALLMSGYPVQY